MTVETSSYGGSPVAPTVKIVPRKPEMPFSKPGALDGDWLTGHVWS